MQSKNTRPLMMVLALVISLSLSGCIPLFGIKQPADLVVTPDQVVIDLDDQDVTVTLTAEVHDKRGKLMEVDAAKIEWAISDPDVAALDQTTGAEVVVTGLAEGETELTVAFGKLSVTVPVKVDGKEPEEPPVPVASDLKVTPANVELDLDDETPAVELTAEVLDQFNEPMTVDGKDIHWEIDDETIAELSSATGLTVTVTAKAEGEAELTITYGELSVTVPVTVDGEELPIPVATELKVTPESVEIDEERPAVELTAEILDQFGEAMTIDAADVTWSIADDTIAELSGTTGLTVTVTGVETGNTTITAAYGELEIEITVTVYLPAEEPEPLLTVDFSQFTQRSDIFDSPNFFHAPGNPDEPLFSIRSGWSGLAIENSMLKMTSARWVVGMPQGLADTTADDEETVGYMDLSKPYVIKLEIGDVNLLKEDGFLQVLVDNNTNYSERSVHGVQSQVFNSGNIEPNATLVIESDKGTETSFLCFRANSGMEIYIKSITIEYQ